MDIKDIEVWIECKRLVEIMLCENRYILERVYKSGKDASVVQKQIARLERALEGKPPLTFEERFKKEFE